MIGDGETPYLLDALIRYGFKARLYVKEDELVRQLRCLVTL